MSLCPGDYRESHASEGYGGRYVKTYSEGYYHHQWLTLEEPLLQGLLRARREAGATRLLDFACGTGRILGSGSAIFDAPTGIDVSDSMLEIARESYPGANIFRHDITREPFEGSFDVITAFRFFLNAQPELRSDVLTALRPLLAPSGRLIANVHVNATSPLGMAYRVRNALKRRTVANTLSFHQFESTLVKHGFEVEDTYWYSYLPRPGWYFGGAVGSLLLPVERVCRVLPVPRQTAQSFMVVARRSDSPG